MWISRGMYALGWFHEDEDDDDEVEEGGGLNRSFGRSID
jgi:hypothetical protein